MEAYVKTFVELHRDAVLRAPSYRQLSEADRTALLDLKVEPYPFLSFSSLPYLLISSSCFSSRLLFELLFFSSLVQFLRSFLFPSLPFLPSLFPSLLFPSPLFRFTVVLFFLLLLSSSYFKSKNIPAS